MSRRRVRVSDKAFPVELLDEDVDELRAPLSAFSTPLMVIDADALESNLRVMAEWARAHGCELMPHGKTTMAPALWTRQLDAGASGITVATGWQARMALSAGVPVVQLAHECLDPRLLGDLDAWLDEHPDQDLVCWVDSPAGLDALERALPRSSRVGVLVELGAEGGRSGVRGFDAARRLAERVAASGTVGLRGVAGYEGALAHDRSPRALAAVRDYCDELVALWEATRDLVGTRPWITAGGSAYFDLVAERFAHVQGARKVVRSGAYVVHDDGFYRGISPLDARAGVPDDEALRPAMHAYARVVSHPEPDLWLLDAGKRDLPFDEGLPVPRASARGLGEPETPLRGARVTALNDQHAFLRADPDEPLAVGDVVRLGISHPCTAFDKWRLIPIADPGRGLVTSAVETFF